MKERKKRRVVITGLGAVAANGIGKEKFWNATTKGISGIKPIELFPTEGLPIQLAGYINDFVVSDYIDRKLANRTDRMTHLAFAAIQEALDDSQLKLEHEDPEMVGAVIANTAGGINYLLEQTKSLYNRGTRFMSAYTAIAWLQVANIGQTSIRYGIQGYCKSPVNDTAGGLDGIGTAYMAIQRGTADVIIAGATEAMFHPFIMVLLGHSGQCATENDPHGYRPFDRRANGLMIAEGAGICIMEEYEHALARGAHIYGEVVGYGQSNDAHDFQVPSSNGKYYAKAITLAMQEGDLRPTNIGYFSLDGQANPTSDQGEAEALHEVFGSELEHIKLSVPRTSIGHGYAAAGALDTVTALLALRDGIVPPTINTEELDPRYGFDLVRNEPSPLSRDANAVMLGARGLGGVNVALALKKVEQ